MAIKVMAAAGLLVAGALAAGSALNTRPASAAAPAASPACAPAGKVSYLCGPANAEDLVLAPGTNWMVVSGMSAAEGSAGKLYLVDAKKKTWKTISPTIGAARAPFTTCGKPDMAKFAAHGLALRPVPGGKHILYAINHGGRESIEVFELNVARPDPVLTWIGCLAAPAGASLNSVAPAPNGGLVVSKFNELGDAKAFAKMAAGEKTGMLYRWNAKDGFMQIPGTEMSGANGVVVSPDGKQVFANAWPEKKVNRYPITGGKPVSISVDFLPDNLRWAPDGKILVAGQASDMKGLLSCDKPRCPHAWTVLKLDPVSMKTTPVLHEQGTLAFSDATGALQVDDIVWVGTYRGDRLAYATVR